MKGVGSSHMFQLQDIVLRNLKTLLYLIWLLHFFRSPLPLPPSQGPPPVVTLRWGQELGSVLPTLCTVSLQVAGCVTCAVP